jgi:hypothetical protein
VESDVTLDAREDLMTAFQLDRSGPIDPPWVRLTAPYSAQLEVDLTSIRVDGAGRRAFRGI